MTSKRAEDDFDRLESRILKKKQSNETFLSKERARMRERNQ